MPEAVVGVRLQQIGAEQTKAELESMRAAMLGVSSATLQQAKDTRQLARDAQALNQSSQLQTRIWLAQHPTINNLTKAMSGMASAARSALAITAAFNIAILAFNSTNSSLTELQAELREVDRQLKITTDPERVRELNDEAGILKAKIKELNEQMTAQQLSNWVGFGAALAIIGEQVLKLVPIISTRLIPALMSAKFAAFGLTAAVAGIGAGAGLADAFGDITSITTIFDQIMKSMGQTTNMAGFFMENIEQMFTGQIPSFFVFTGIAFEELGRRIVKVWEGIILTTKLASQAIIKIVNGIVEAIRDAISAFSKLIGLGSNNPSTNRAAQPRTIRRASGGIIDEPVMGVGLRSGNTWSFGESGNEMVVPMTGGTRAGGGAGGGTYYNITVHGSILTIDQLWREIDKRTKQSIRDRGGTGF